MGSRRGSAATEVFRPRITLISRIASWLAPAAADALQLDARISALYNQRNPWLVFFRR